MQVPYERADTPVACYTVSTARQAGWTCDIGLDTRRSVSYVYSSAHIDDTPAERALRDYVGPAARDLSVRQFRFESGYREIQWRNNCVAIGHAAGCFEPLEATDSVLVEAAAALIAQNFPWTGEFDAAARQFNRVMAPLHRRVRDFLKLHYCLTQRSDSAFWRDNTQSASIPEILQDLLERWRYRPPQNVDFNPDIDVFSEFSWQFVLYGMGFETDLSAEAAAFRSRARARREFADITREARQVAEVLPSHRELLTQAYGCGFCGQVRPWDARPSGGARRKPD